MIHKKYLILAALISGIFIFSIITIHNLLSKSKSEQVKEAFKHAWNGYKKYSFGKDELNSLTKTNPDEMFQGWGATMIDSLTTLWIMDLKQDFRECVSEISKINFSTGNGKPLLIFETNIRYLGGLISAYDLSGEPILLEKAIQLADILILSFDSKSGLPYPNLNLETRQGIDEFDRVILSEVGTMQLEFSRLSHITNNTKYKDKAYKVYDILNKMNKKRKGLYPVFISLNTKPVFTTAKITFGSLGDSFYEYLLKSYIMDRNPLHLDMFKESLEGMRDLIVKIKNTTYLAEIDESDNINYKMDHLSFFIPALLTLASNVLVNHTYLQLAKDLSDTYYSIYYNSQTKLGPEMVEFSEHGIEVKNPSNNLRPELLESLFYLYKYTGDLKYQDRAFELFSKNNVAYSSYNNVNDIDKIKQQNGKMESFFFAETFKYMYLSFLPTDHFDLNTWVFNTEAHPLKINSKQ